MGQGLTTPDIKDLESLLNIKKNILLKSSQDKKGMGREKDNWTEEWEISCIESINSLLL